MIKRKENFDLNIGDIYMYETDRLSFWKDKQVQLYKLRDVFQEIILSNKDTEPVFDLDNLTEEQKQDPYYIRQIKEYDDTYNDIQRSLLLGYFIIKFKCYEYGDDIYIRKEQKYFDYFFALKLRQYRESIKDIRGFFKYQLSLNFRNNRKKFRQFVEDLLLQYENVLLQDKVTSVAKDLIASEEFDSKIKNLKSEHSINNNSEIHTKRIVISKGHEGEQSNELLFEVYNENDIEKIFLFLINGFISASTPFETFKRCFIKSETKHSKVNLA
jgi:hypothetical protein